MDYCLSQNTAQAGNITVYKFLLMNSSRKKRIARGSGMELSELNAFVTQFEQMRKMMQGFGALKNTFKKGGKSALYGKMPKGGRFR